MPVAWQIRATTIQKIINSMARRLLLSNENQARSKLVGPVPLFGATA
jgi:hypothetical protein